MLLGCKPARIRGRGKMIEGPTFQLSACILAKAFEQKTPVGSAVSISDSLPTHFLEGNTILYYTILYYTIRTYMIDGAKRENTIKGITCGLPV